MATQTTKVGTAGAQGSMNFNIVDEALAMSLSRLRSDLLVTSLIKNYTEEARDQGSRFAEQVSIPRRGAITVQDKAQQATISPIALTDDTESLTVNKHKVVDMLLEDWGVLFSGNNTGLLSGYVSDAADSLAEEIEGDVIGNFTGASRVLGSPQGGASSALIRETRKNSKNDKWQMSEPLYYIWGPEATEDLLGEALFVQVNRSGSDDALTRASLGTKFGFDHFESNLMPTIAGSPGAEHAIAFQEEAMGIAFLPMDMADIPAEFSGAGTFRRSMMLEDDNGRAAYSIRLTASYDANNIGSRVQIDTMYGTNVIRAELLYDVLV